MEGRLQSYNQHWASFNCSSMTEQMVREAEAEVTGRGSGVVTPRRTPSGLATVAASLACGATYRSLGEALGIIPGVAQKALPKGGTALLPSTPAAESQDGAPHPDRAPDSG